MTSFVRGNQLLFIAKMLFTFSTIYTMAYFWTAGSGEVLDSEDLGDQEYAAVGISEDAWTGNLVIGAVEDVLSIIDYFNPFARLLGLLVVIIPSDLYVVINLLLFRPIGWIGAFITTEWVINKIRGVSE